MTDTGPYQPPLPPDPGGPPPASARPRWWLRITVGVAILAVLLCGAPVAVGLFWVGTHKDSADSDAPAAAGRPAGQSPSAAARDGADKVKGKVPKGSKASSYAVRKVEDLNRVCDGWFYPKNPKYAGTAPHAITLGVKDQKDSDTRLAKTTVDLPYDASDEVKAAWNPADPKKVRLMACADQVSVGAKVKDCQVDDPKPEKVPMKASTYRVTLYEVATRRQLAQVKMTGEDETCGPLFIMVGADGATYTGLENRQLIEALRRYVEE